MLKIPAKYRFTKLVRYRSESTAQNHPPVRHRVPTHPKRPSVAIALSGGVDSSVAACLLKEQGYDVIGIHMKNWSEPDEKGYCPFDEDAKQVELLAQHLSIPVKTVNFEKEYWNNVFQPMIMDYSEGVTPNPDVLCNREIKFKVLVEAAQSFGAEFLATGHYARLRPYGDGVNLVQATDTHKDQTFFLSLVEESVLRRVIFPVGHMYKRDVKSLARYFGLPNADRKESMGVCFVGKRNFSEFLSGYIPFQSGSFIDIATKMEVGTHDGLPFYTLGQAARISGLKEKFKKYFVVSKDKNTNSIYVGEWGHPALYSRWCQFETIHWITPPSAIAGSKDSLQIQYKIRHPFYEKVLPFGTLELGGNELGAGLRLRFEAPERAVAVGQTIAMYLDDVCLGGAKIAATGIE